MSDELTETHYMLVKKDSTQFLETDPDEYDLAISVSNGASSLVLIDKEGYVVGRAPQYRIVFDEHGETSEVVRIRK